MEVLFLGTGTSQGVPMIGCECAVCRSPDPRNRRGRPCIHVVMGGLHLQIDAGPEFREQCIRDRVPKIDLFILTHSHADHILGMDDLRRYCDMRGFEGIPVYSSQDGVTRLKQVYPYAIGARPVFRGYPAFMVHLMPPVLDLGVGKVSSTMLPHGPVKVLGLVFEEAGTGAKFTYYTDCKEVGTEARALARGSRVVVLDGLRPEPHPTHMTHAVDHGPVEETLPPSVRLAYDGLRLTL